MLLFLLCVGVVAYNAQHITNSIRVGSAMDRIVSDALRSESTWQRRDVEDSSALPEPPEGTVIVPDTLDRDVTYGLRQLVDVAIRAMSPSLNDLYTAVEAIDHSATS